MVPTIEHGSATQDNGRNIYGSGSHNTGRGRFVAARCQNNAIQRVAIKNLNEAKIGEIAIKRCRRTFAGLLNRMDRELKGNAAGGRNAFTNALGKLNMMAVAGRKVRSRLRNTNNRLTRLKLFAREAKIEISFEIQRRHARIFGIVEPKLRTKLAFLDSLRLGDRLIGHFLRLGLFHRGLFWRRHVDLPLCLVILADKNSYRHIDFLATIALNATINQ